MAGLRPPRPLAAEDECGTFDCGREPLNTWLRRYAWRNQQSNASRTSVLCDPESGRLLAYVSLSAAQIEREYLPKTAQRNQPTPLPIILLGQLAVDQRDHGRGYARSMMLFALTTALHASRTIGCVGVATHPIDEGVRSFYRRFGFEDLPGDPRRAMFVRMMDVQRNQP